MKPYRKRINRLRQKPVTAIQRRILELMALGYMQERIARRLRRSTSTIQYHRAILRVKLHCKNNAELLRYYWTHNQKKRLLP